MISQDILRVCKLIQSIDHHNAYNLSHLPITKGCVYNRIFDNGYQWHKIYTTITKIIFVYYAKKNNIVSHITNNIIYHNRIKDKRITSYENHLFDFILKQNKPLNFETITAFFFIEYIPNFQCQAIFGYLFWWENTDEGRDFWSKQHWDFIELIDKITWKDLIIILSNELTNIKPYL